MLGWSLGYMTSIGVLCCEWQGEEADVGRGRAGLQGRPPRAPEWLLPSEWPQEGLRWLAVSIPASLSHPTKCLEKGASWGEAAPSSEASPELTSGVVGWPQSWSRAARPSLKAGLGVLIFTFIRQAPNKMPPLATGTILFLFAFFPSSFHPPFVCFSSTCSFWDSHCPPWSWEPRAPEVCASAVCTVLCKQEV